jgi:hypothetical protein
MALPEQAATEEEDRKNRGPRMSVELSFNKIVREFTHRLLCNASNIAKQMIKLAFLKSLWDLQVLFCNLFTSAQGHGNPCNYILGVPPPTVAEYLFSGNNNLLVQLIMHDEEDDNFSNENAEDKALHNHMVFDNNHRNFN